MFLACTVPATGIKPGRNVLHLAFRSLDTQLRERRPRPRWRTPMIENQQLRWIRTTVLGRTPGWSLPAAPVGPWREIRIVSHPPAVDEIRLGASVAGTNGILEFRARTSLAAQPTPPLLSLRLDGVEVASAIVERRGTFLEARLEITNVERWWPHTHGRPALYDAVLLAVGLAGQPAEFPMGRIGFRTVTLNSDREGPALAINGVDVFCRGACWTPIDPVSLATDRNTLKLALEQATVAGFNMLRVTGVGVYEDEEFFTLCDSMGIMVWQDFMFASMDFPTGDADFRDSVVREAEQQLRLWDRHPSVSVVCGNSEVSQQSAMWGRPREDWNPDFFSTLLRDLAREHCPQACYWPSSAWGGDFPHQASAGTSSYYGVGAYMRELADAKHSGLIFATECLGFANIPEDATLSRLAAGTPLRTHTALWKRRSPRDLGAGWDFDDVRDHYVQRLFGVDPTSLRYADHARYLTLGRQAVAEAMGTAYTYWRSPGSRCKGALVWLLRDLWPGAGWGIVDSTGDPKSPWYELRRNLQPQWIGISDEGLNGIAVHMVNESATACAGTLRLTLYRDGRHVAENAERIVELGPRSGTTLNAVSLLAGFQDLGHAYRFGPLGSDLIVASFRPHTGREMTAFFLPRTDLHLQPRGDCTLQARAEPLPGTADYRLVVSCSGFARGVHIDVPGYSPSDQYFNLEARASVELRLFSVAENPRVPSGCATAVNISAPAAIQLAS